MALDEKDIKKISDSISGAISKGFGDISGNLERIITQQRTNIPNSALDYRGSNFGRRVYGEDIEQQLKRLTRDLQRQYADTRTATGGGRMFNGVTGPSRELKYEQDRVKDAIQSYRNTIDELKKTYNLIGKSDAEALKELKEQFDELTEAVKEQQTAIDKVREEIIDTTSLSQEEIVKLNKLIKNTSFDSIFGDDGEINETSLTNLVKELNKLFDGKDVFTTEYVRDLANAQHELNKSETKRADVGKDIAKSYEQQTEALREQTRYADLSIRTMKDGISDISRGFDKLKRLAIDFTEGWRKVDQASANFAKNIGVGSRGLIALRKNTIDMVANKGIGLNYGIGMDELIQIQQGYMKTTGRNVGLTSEDIETGAAMSRLMGDKGGEFAQALENFGLSYAEAGKRAGKMFADASKAGLSFEKYSDNFLKNIKMAQKYTFRDGLKGLERMAKKATEIRMDMQNIASFAEKVSTLQGAAETSAQLQVLGGPFAQFSDPLGMLNEGLNDMEGLMNRVDKMMDNMAKFNSQTGQVDINTFNRQRLRAAAQAMNIPYEQLLETAQEKGRRNFVNQQLNASGRKFTDAEREFLMNTATVQNGQAIMTYFDQNGNRIEKNASQLTPQEIEQARRQNQSDSDNIKTIAKDTRSFNEKVDGIKKTIEAIKAEAIEPHMTKIEGMLDSAQKYLGAIKFAVIAIAALTAGGSLLQMGKGVVNTVRGGSNFLRAGRFFRGTGTTVPANVTGGAGGRFFGSMLAKATPKTGVLAGSTAAGALALVAGAAATIAGIGKGIHDFRKSKEMKEERDKAIASGKYKKGSKEDIEATIAADKKKRQGIGGATGTAIGAAIGTAILPGIGTAIGAGIGWGAGALIGRATGKKKREQEIAKRQKEREEERQLANSLKFSGFDLKGGYTALEYKQIMSAINQGGDRTITQHEFESLPEELRKKLMTSEDISLFPELQDLAIKETKMDAESVTIDAANVTFNGDVPKKEKGGMLFGPSHSMGGIPLIAEGGEYIINKNATKKHFGLLTAINADKYGGGGGQPGVQPSNNEGMKPVKVLAALDGGNGFSGGGYSGVNNVNVNISGTIKLDGGNGRTVDMTALLRDPVFIRQITNLIEQQMTFNTRGARYTNKLRP